MELPALGLSDDGRRGQIVRVLEEAFARLMHRDPEAFRRRFRKMAADPFAFYRGSACLYYTDVIALDDPWVDNETRRVWIHGDLHAENFGSSMDGRGVLVFDVNDFDEAYLGHYTWDLMRCAASLALIGWRKAFPDRSISDIIATFVTAYVDQVRYYRDVDNDHAWALRLDNARGEVLDALHVASNSTRVKFLDRDTVVENYQRRFHAANMARPLDDDEKQRVLAAFRRYCETIPSDKRLPDMAYRVKDVIGRSGFGIGSAGLAAYNVLVEGHTQALENDVVLSMKEGNVAAVSRVLHDARLDDAFEHHGHRTALSRRALQVFTDPYLGWTETDGTGFVVSELSPYEADLKWDDISEPNEALDVVEQLGRATAKVHCVSDGDAEQIVVEGQVEDVIADVIGNDARGLCEHITDFALSYAACTRRDHALFVDAFREGEFSSVAAI